QLSARRGFVLHPGEPRNRRRSVAQRVRQSSIMAEMNVMKRECTMTTQNEEFQRIRGYLQAQAAKLTIPDLVEKVRTDTAPLREIGAAVPPDRFGERPGSDDWSAAEVYTHVLQMNDLGVASIEGILDSGALPPRIDDVMTGETRRDLKSAGDYWQTYS